MDKKTRLFAMTLDLESDFSGALHREYALLRQPQRVERLLGGLKERGVPLSAFVVGELLERFPELIELFVNYGTEFHCHSYGHDPEDTDSGAEIKRARDAYVQYFGSSPLGYRAPDGRISRDGIAQLGAHGFKFDASIFPSYYPNPFKYLFRRSQPHFFGDTQVVEIPNTPVSPLRIMLSLSYIKLLGIRPYIRLLRWSRLPETAVFGSHLHDFFTDSEALSRMPRFWRMVYGRNRDRGLDFLDDILDFFQGEGYSFVTMSEVYAKFVERSESLISQEA
jgi:peptidoglycan/xylan/chitin deacetylase (PgdA/CDA1 family)